MTTTTWTTAADIPPGPWAAMGADIRRLLAVSAAGGATVTGPNGIGSPLLNEDVIAFVVTAPQSQPMAVTFQRAAGTGTVTTNAPHTDGLVLAAMNRAARHWGSLVTIETDAGTTSRAVAGHLVEGLFGDEDRAVAANARPGVPSRVAQIVARAHNEVGTRVGAPLDLLGYLNALIAQLNAERDGIAVAESVLNPPPATPENTPA